jgi:Uncharacterized protein involved in tolerance to divalent cations
MTPYIQVVTTAPDRASAEQIADRLLEARLAACVQISPCTSRYHWQGAIEQAEEMVCTVKSRRDLFAEVCRVIRSLHPTRCRRSSPPRWWMALPPISTGWSGSCGPHVRTEAMGEEDHSKRGRRRRKEFRCHCCKQEKPFCWNCTCGFQICPECFEETSGA